MSGHFLGARLVLNVPDSEGTVVADRGQVNPTRVDGYGSYSFYVSRHVMQ